MDKILLWDSRTYLTQLNLAEKTQCIFSDGSRCFEEKILKKWVLGRESVSRWTEGSQSSKSAQAECEWQGSKTETTEANKTQR